LVSSQRGNLTAHEASPDSHEYRQFALPLPAPDREAWERNLQNALAMDPRRRDNYERYLRAQRGTEVDYIPIRLDIENVSRCNFRCSMCQVSGWGPKYQRAKDMTLQEFKDLIDEQYGLVEIKLHGMGEPLLGGEVFLDMVRYARSKGIWVRTSTNGSLLHFKDNYKKLVETGINEVQISFDGATKETFESIRNGSKFELEVRNCKLINDYCNQNGLLVTRMWVLLQRANAHEFHDFVEIAGKMGFRRLTYSLNLHGWGQEKWLAANESKAAEGSVSLEMARASVDRGRQLGLETTFWNITSKYSTDKVEHLCPWPFQWAYISSDMRIVPCPMIANPDVMELGDARKFTSEWNGKNFKEFRQAHLDGKIPKHCKICYMSGSISRKARP
jgi:MoaA/NifB/PqqE/SkfB family radical SAM enzyme